MRAASASSPALIGVDLGGTKTEACVVSPAALAGDAPLAPLARVRVPTPAAAGYDAILEATTALVARVAAEAGVGLREARVGVGMPGSVGRAGLVRNSNTTCLNGRPFRRDLEERLALGPGRVAFDNDANLFALAEARLGAARGLPGVVFGVILGTGVGGGVVVDGRVWPGRDGVAGEWGHHAVWAESPSARACYCGGRGCVEAHLSGPALEAQYVELGGARRPLAEIVARREVEEAAARVVEAMLGTFARGLANVVDVLDPTAIVLGGGLSNLDCLYDEGRRRVGDLVFSDAWDAPILRPALGDSAGVFGAACLAASGVAP